jgi:site-specific DNA recombinase
VFPGEQPAILDRDLFEAVQARLNDQRNNHTAARSMSESPLIGRVYDDRGNRMSPSHARKEGIRYRYYVSSSLLQGQAGHAGSVCRVPAADVEALAGQAVREHLKGLAPAEDKDLIRAHVLRVDVQADDWAIELAEAKKKPPPGTEEEKPPSRDSGQLEADRIVLRVPWKKPPSKRRREIIMPQSTAPQDVRPIRAETRATLVASIARGRRWLDEIVAGTATVEQIAVREQCNIRQVNMTISLAFLAPRLVQAAVQGRLPRGIGVTRLRDAPAEWSRQYAILGLSV